MKTMSRTKYHAGQRVKSEDGRIGTLVRQNAPHPQWLVRLENGELTWWWEGMIAGEVSA